MATNSSLAPGSTSPGAPAPNYTVPDTARPSASAPGASPAISPVVSASLSTSQYMTVAQVLQLLESMKQSIIQANRNDQNKMEMELKESIKVITDTMRQVYICVSSTTFDYNKQKGNKKAYLGLPAMIPYLDLLTNPDLGAEDNVRFVFMATVWSFTREMCNTKGWISDESTAMYSNMFGSCVGVAGLSLIYFAARNFDTKATRDNPVRKACAEVMKLTLAKKVDITRKMFGGIPGGPDCDIPEWLKSFKGGQKTVAYVSSILEQKPKRKRAKRASSTTADQGSKRARLSNDGGGHQSVDELRSIPARSPAVDGPPVAAQPSRSLPPFLGCAVDTASPLASGRTSTGQSSAGFSSGAQSNSDRSSRGVPGSSVTAEAKKEDPLAEARRYAILAARSRLSRVQATARTESRKKLFQALLFLVEKIRDLGGAARAKENGYEIIFSPDIVDEIDCVRDVLTHPQDNKWNIPLCGTTLESDLENNHHFEDLQKAFPSLRLTLKYRRKVVKGDGDISDGSADWENDDLHYHATEFCDLHHLAATLLLSAYRMESFAHILRCSDISLRAIHVLAVGLLGVVRRACGHTTSLAEDTARGACTDKHVQPDGSEVSLLYGFNSNTKDDDADDNTELKQMRKDKFEMQWGCYVKEKKKVAKNPTPSLRSSYIQGESSESEEEADYWNWTEKSGRGLPRAIVDGTTGASVALQQSATDA